MVNVYQSIQRNIPGYLNLQAGCCKNLNSSNEEISGFRFGAPKVRTESEREREREREKGENKETTKTSNDYKERRRKKLTSSCHSLPECCSPTAASALGSLHTPI
jgi:hypothetical protein